MNVDDDDDEDIVRSSSKRKFSRIIDSDSDSDRENDSNNRNKAADDDDDSDSGAKVSSRKRSKADDEPSAKKKIKLEPADDTKAAKDFQRALQANLDKTEELSDVKEIVDVPVVYRHQTLEFLKPDKIRDAEKRKPSDPKYDSTTLYVPKDYLDSLTPVSNSRTKSHFSSQF